MCQALRALYNIAAAQEPSHISTLARKMPRHAVIPQSLMEPTLTRCPPPPPRASLTSPWSPLPMQLSSLRSLPGFPFPTPLPSAPPPWRDVSAALPPQPPHHTPPRPRTAAHHRTPSLLASLPNGCHSDRRGNPILWSSTSQALAWCHPLQLILKSLETTGRTR